MRRCDAVFCCANDNPPDEGALVELGIAIGLRKATFIYRDDFRTCDRRLCIFVAEWRADL